MKLHTPNGKWETFTIRNIDVTHLIFFVMARILFLILINHNIIHSLPTVIYSVNYHLCIHQLTFSIKNVTVENFQHVDMTLTIQLVFFLSY